MDYHSALLWLQNLIASLYLGTQSGPRNALGCVPVLVGKPSSLLPMARWWATSYPGLVPKSVQKPQADPGRAEPRAIPAAKSLGLYLLLAGERRWRGDACKAHFPAPAKAPSLTQHPCCPFTGPAVPVQSLLMWALSPSAAPHILPDLQSVHIYLLSTSHLARLGFSAGSRPLPH